MNPHSLGSSSWALLLAVTASLGVAAPGPGAAPFDYFRNSWQVIGLKDYKDGTRVTPQNELLLGDKRKLHLLLGAKQSPLGAQPMKTLLEGWLPVVLLSAEAEGVRYEITLWATPLPTVKDWPAAFDWPTEGENFLNWVKVKATGPGTGPKVAQVRFLLTGGAGEQVTDRTLPLTPGQSGEIVFQVPYLPMAQPLSLGEADAALWLGRTLEYWHGLFDKGARLEVPCEKASQTLKAAHVCQLIASDHGELHAGEGFYDEFYIRDGGYQLLELEEAGLWSAASNAVAVYLRSQRPDGRFESQKDQYDANGQALWTLWQYWKITGDLPWLRQAYPLMRRAADWARTVRHRAAADSPFTGLLPAAPADGEYLWDGKHHIVGYDIWNLRGLLCTADAARALGQAAEAREIENEAAAYRQAIDAAWKATGLAHFPPSWEKDGTPWGNTETLWPTELFEPDDPRVAATVTEAREHHGGGFVEGTIRWTGLANVIHPYLSSYTTMASLLRGDHEKFAEEFYWYLLHSSASHAFPEGIFYKRRYAWGETIPHVLGAANFAFMLRHALVHERGDELHLLMGTPDWWLGEGKTIRVQDAPTHFGPMGLWVKGTDKGVEVRLDLPRRQPPKRVVLHLPTLRRPLTSLKEVEVVFRPDQSRRWDVPTVVDLYQKRPAPQIKVIPGLVSWPLKEVPVPERCRTLDLASLANTDPLNAPFGVPKPGKYLFTGLPVGRQSVLSVPFDILDSARNQGRGLVVLNGAGASARFPREVTLPVKDQGKRLFFLGNVHGWSSDDEGAGDWGAVAEYVLHYADGQTQTVPLITLRTCDDWAVAPEASAAPVGLKGDPWHLNVLGVDLRPVALEKVVFRDLGTPAAPVLVGVTLEK
jgi:hypothetical protein